MICMCAGERSQENTEEQRVCVYVLLMVLQFGVDRLLLLLHSSTISGSRLRHACCRAVIIVAGKQKRALT